MITKATKQKLYQLNREFYLQQAENFSATRNYAWSGWEKFWEIIAPVLPEQPLVFDLGCGNGRFLQFLLEKNIRPNYLGVDNSRKLLNIAVDNYAALNDANFAMFDLESLLLDNSSEPERILKAKISQEGKFDLITLFGVLHHIPGLTDRRLLLAKLLPYLGSGGIVVISFWQFMNISHYKNKVIPWSECDLQEKDVETGDHLLDWRKQGSYRYCHHFSTEEIDRLIPRDIYKIKAQFNADGFEDRMNSYLILERI